ncbi:SLBB domain-containing protein [Mucilaginibacter sp. UR6-11]|uniref:SLBB domain-containing protein n=1 Tax=Mucilaginibacter sp. UR6-11 TaxID=1435644 RepID=UPI001E2E7F81|nr:SLBB domain-containing protein [Mucilaginibacter sp. UR6-11]MCC8423963.1 SLBB domain-containing protein [Mucilaginibacter sp. UR6-11]
MGDLKGMKVSQATDEQITQAWQKIQDSGLSEQQAYALMTKNGVSGEELQAFKDRVTLLGLNKKASPQKAVTSTEKQKTGSQRDIIDLVVKPTPLERPVTTATQPALEVYGTQFFKQAITFEPSFSIATPKSYVLGPGDKVIILLTGLNEKNLESTVTPDGNLQIPFAGLVYVNGFTIEQATSLIRSKMLKIYPALASGQTQLTVNLGSTRSIRVTVKGEVKTPGSYTLSSLATLPNALYNSGGPGANGSLRYIKLIRNNKLYKIIDFYTYLQSGIQEGNIRLEDQDVIQIPVYKKRVSISGEVKNPAIYELKDDEHLDDVIRFASGFTDVAYTGIAKVDQINDLQREVKDVPANLFANYTPHNGDKVLIGAITNRYTNRVVLEGAVYRPDVYELTAGLTLSQLLKSAQGLKPEAYLERGYINRTLPNLEKQSITFKPGEIINGVNDIPLLREDTVVIMDREAFVSSQTVTVSGHVRRPSIITYRKGLKLADVIAMSGGFKDDAADHHVEVNRVIKNESDSVANQQVNTFVVDLSNNNDANRDIELQPMDVINVPRLVNYRALGNVVVKGEVVFPGDYPVERRNETALDFLRRAGGVTPYGSMENAQVYRNGVRVNLDLSLKNNKPEANKDMVLLPGDSIYVPRVISYVEVSGAVNNPQYISFNGGRFKYYINAAAGTTQNARLKGAYIQYPDGLNQPVRHFLFFRHYPTVKPGSKIIVPEKAPDNKIKIGFGDLGSIAAALTALVSIVAILHK